MIGIKFRRNLKAVLFDTVPGEVVYALDTDEWGLGLENGEIVWRKHEFLFKNFYLNGDDIPPFSLGEMGMYYFDKINLEVYQKSNNGWGLITFPISQTVIESNFISTGSVPNYTDISTIVRTSGALKAPLGYSAMLSQEVVTKQDLLDETTFLDRDGSTPMKDGYVGLGDGVVIKQQIAHYAPPKNPTMNHSIQNFHGLPEINTQYSDVLPVSFESFGIGYCTVVKNNKIYTQVSNEVHIIDFDTMVDLKTIYSPSGGWFGTSISVSDTRIYIGNPAKTIAGDANAGVVYVFDLEGNFLFEINSPSPNYVGKFGQSSVIYRNKLYIGAEGEHGENFNTGQVHSFDLDGNHLLTMFPPDSWGNVNYETDFGYKIVPYGDFLYIAAPHHSHGWIYKFDLNGNHILRMELGGGTATGAGYDFCIYNNLIYCPTNFGSPGSHAGMMKVVDLNGNLVEDWILTVEDNNIFSKIDEYDGEIFVTVRINDVTKVLIMDPLNGSIKQEVSDPLYVSSIPTSLTVHEGSILLPSTSVNKTMCKIT